MIDKLGLKKILEGRSSFASDVLKLAGGTAIAQALAILASPIITRMYGPEAFGLSALFASITGIIAVVACLRYELAIMLPEKDEDSANLLVLSLFLAAIMSGLTALVFWLTGDAFLGLLKAPGLKPYLWIMPISVFLSGVFVALNYWNSRTKRFGRLSIARVAASVATTGTQLAAGFMGCPTGGSLIGAGLLGSFISTLMLGGQIWRDDCQLFKDNLSWQQMADSIKHYKNFPIFDSWAALINVVSWQLPIFLLSSFFSSSVVGYYSLGLTVLQLPMSLIGSAIGQVFFQRAAKAKTEGKKYLASVVESTFLNLCILGLFPVLLLFVIGDDVFIVVFGSKWAEAGVYVQILALWVFFWFIYSPTSTLFSILEIQKNYLIFNIILIITRAGALTIGGVYGSARLALILFSFFGIIIYAGVNFWLLSNADVSIRIVIMKFLQYIILSIVLLSILAFAKFYMNLSPIWLVFLGVIAALSYYSFAAKKIKEYYDVN